MAERVKQDPGVATSQEVKPAPAANILPSLNRLIEEALAFKASIEADKIHTPGDVERSMAALRDSCMKVQFASNGISRNGLNRREE